MLQSSDVIILILEDFLNGDNSSLTSINALFPLELQTALDVFSLSTDKVLTSEEIDGIIRFIETGKLIHEINCRAHEEKKTRNHGSL